MALPCLAATDPPGDSWLSRRSRLAARRCCQLRGYYRSGRRAWRKPSHGSRASSVSVLRVRLLRSTRQRVRRLAGVAAHEHGGGNGACVSSRHCAARAAGGVAWHGKVAFGVLWPSFSLPAGDASRPAPFFAGASVVSACSRRPPGAGLAGGGCARASQAGCHAAARARSPAASIRGAVQAGPRVGRASDSAAADVACGPGAAGGYAGFSCPIRPGPAAGDRAGSSCPWYRTAR